jgi:hypothetical protein
MVPKLNFIEPFKLFLFIGKIGLNKLFNKLSRKFDGEAKTKNPIFSNSLNF